MRYASETQVPVERSRADIEEMLRKYGAAEFTSGWTQTSHMIAFKLRNLLIRFVLPMPSVQERRFQFRKNKRTNREEKRTEQQTIREWEQERRQRWRALRLVIQAKLEAIECGISTMEQEFLAFIVMPNELTFGEWVLDNLLPQIAAGQMPKMLEAPKGPKVIEAEVIQ